MQSESRTGSTKHQVIKNISLIIVFAVLLAATLITSCQPAATVSREAWVPYARLTDSVGEETEVRFFRLEEPGQRRYGGTNSHIKSVMQRAPGSLAWQVDLPAGESMLEFTLSYLCPDETVPGPVVAKVTVEHDGEREEIYDNSIWVRPVERGFMRYDERLPLSRFAGKSVTIHFETTVGENSPEEVDFAWGYPAIYKRENTDLPNIILVCMDTLRADRVGFINPESELMPNLMALADDGVAFTNAISQAPWTLPSVAAVLTGQYPSFHGAGKRIFLPETIDPEQLDEEKQKLGIMIGRSDFVVSKLPDRSITLPEMMESRYLCQIVNGNSVIGTGTNVETRFPCFIEGTAKGWSLTEQAREWLQDNRDKRFFLYIQYMEPHQWPLYYKEKWEREGRHDVDKASWMYDEMVKMGDEFFGRMLERVKELGLYEDSLIIFYSDHGEHLYDEVLDTYGHGMSLSNILLHVPVVVKFPGNKYAGTRVSDYVKVMDIFETVVSESGTVTPEGFTSQGVPLRDIVEGKLDVTFRDTISEFLLAGRERIALQAGPYRLIHTYDIDKQRLVDAATDKRIPFGSSREAREVSNRLIKEILAYVRVAEMLQDGLEISEFSEEELEALRQLGYVQ